MKNLQDAAVYAGQGLSDRFENLEEKKDMMSVKEYNIQKNVLVQEEEILQKKFYNQRVDLDGQFHRSNQILERYLKKIINDTAYQHQITVIISKTLTLYNDESVDVTDEVISQLNTQLKFIAVS